MSYIHSTFTYTYPNKSYEFSALNKSSANSTFRTRFLESQRIIDPRLFVISRKKVEESIKLIDDLK